MANRNVAGASARTARKPWDKKAVTQQDVTRAAVQGNYLYWDIHSLIHACLTLALEFEEDEEGVTELQTLLRMTSEKALQMYDCITVLSPAEEASNV